MHLFALLVLCLAKGVFGGNDTCKPIVSLEQLKGLHISDFATPWGSQTFETFCGYLGDFYSCVDAEDETFLNGPTFGEVLNYFQKYRIILKELCTVNEPLYGDYKRYEECYLKVKDSFSDCLIHVAEQKSEYFEVPWRWPQNDANVEQCIKGTELFFCMADHIQQICDDPAATRFYLQIARFTDLPAIYCRPTQLCDVQTAIRMMSRDCLIEMMRRRRARS